MARPRKSVTVARDLARVPHPRLNRHHESPHVLRRLCAIADEKTNCGDKDGLRVAALCCRLAQRLDDADGRVLAFARLATALRFAARFRHAELALDIAFSFGFEHLKGDLLRRRAWLRSYQQRYEEALTDAKAAAELTAGPDHAKSLEILGITCHHLDDYRGAIRDLGACLAETDPDAKIPYCHAIHNYATALAKGTDEEAARAVELCAELRPRLKHRHKMQRAKLWWTEGLLHKRLGDPLAAWRCLNNARSAFVAMGGRGGARRDRGRDGRPLSGVARSTLVLRRGRPGDPRPALPSGAAPRPGVGREREGSGSRGRPQEGGDGPRALPGALEGRSFRRARDPLENRRRTHSPPTFRARPPR